MPRRPRLAAPGVPMHITQRGHNRMPTFADAVDFAQYRAFLQYASRREQCAIHAYALMTNHTHLLVTPSTVMGASRMMQLLGRLYVQHYNRRHRRSGTLWEGRFKSSVVDTSSYLLTCSRYIDMNPVRAFMVRTADAYEWSSYLALAEGAADDLVTPHPEYLGLGKTPRQRQREYRAFCNIANGLRAAPVIRRVTLRGEALGRAEFQRAFPEAAGVTRRAAASALAAN